MTANQTVTGSTGTIGSMTLDTSSSASVDFTRNIQGSLTIDDAGSTGTIGITGNGTKLMTISATLVLTDNLWVNVPHTTSASSAGDVTFTGGWSGAGGLTKDGAGFMTIGTVAKAYTGPTVLNMGRLRFSNTGAPSQTSSFTVNNGGQITTISSASPIQFGAATSVPLNLNGTGIAQFPGAIRPETGGTNTFPNVVVLQSDSLVHMQATGGTGGAAIPTGTMTFSNQISGTGKLTFTAPNSNIDIGNYVLNGANTYQGGTVVAGGAVRVGGSTATLGTGDVEVNNATSTSSIARLEIQSGVTNAIADTATLKLAGGGAAGVADQSYIILDSAVNEQVGGLVLGGVVQTLPGTYGATGSGATFQFDEYFSGPGIVTLVPAPEPASFSLLAAIAGFGLLKRSRRSA